MKQAWIWFLGLLLCISATACNSETAAENIDTFTCAWLPWWMADCSSSEVHNKAIESLHNGLIEASVSCTGTYQYINAPDDGNCFHTNIYNLNYTLNVTRLQDGSCFVQQNSDGHRDIQLSGVYDYPNTPGVNSTYFISAGDPNSATCHMLLNDTTTADFTEGNLVINPHTLFVYHVANTSGCQGTDVTPTTTVSLSTCTGFNKDHF